MGKMALIVLAGVLLIGPGAGSASAVGRESAVQSVADPTSPPVVLALAAGHSISIISRSGAVAVPNARIRAPQQCSRPCGRLKTASPEAFGNGMLRKVDSCRPEC